MNSDIFVNVLLSDKIKLQPSCLNRNIKLVLIQKLREKFEGKCTHNGYIRISSIEIVKYSLGAVQAFSLNGDMIFNILYKADVCNPCAGSIVKAKVLNSNRFGFIAESGMFNNKGEYIPILEIIIAKQSMNQFSKVDVEKIQRGMELNVEILGKKFQLNDKKISVVGQIIYSDYNRNILDRGIDDVDDEDDDVQEVDTAYDNDVEDGDDDDDGIDDKEEEEDEEEEEEAEEENDELNDDDDSFYDDEDDVQDGGNSDSSEYLSD